MNRVDEQYLDLLRTIQAEGTPKPPSREGMPPTMSYFGYQMRFNLNDGFPILTTKQVYWKGVVIELLWFLRGDTNVKYLNDNGVTFWNEDSFNFYTKLCDKQNIREHYRISFELFVSYIKNAKSYDELVTDSIRHAGKRIPRNYVLGDCGFQYGKVWRDWEGDYKVYPDGSGEHLCIDQIAKVIKSLKFNPDSRRHIVTAVDPAHDNDLALYWCHAMFQFNTRALTLDQRFKHWFHNQKPNRWVVDEYDKLTPLNQARTLDDHGVPKYFLDCQLYQRSADAFLGCPLNISSYSLITHMFAKMCNMLPGHYIHTFGDVHIYDNHREQVAEQLLREPYTLPEVKLSDDVDWIKLGETLDFASLKFSDFKLEGYMPHPEIKAPLSTGLKR